MTIEQKKDSRYVFLNPRTHSIVLKRVLDDNEITQRALRKELSQMKQTLSQMKVQIEMLKGTYVAPKITTKAALVEIVRRNYEAHMNITPLDDYHLSRSKRHNESACPRMILMYMLRYLNLGSTLTIGHFCGGRDHSTVIHATTAIDDRMVNERMLRHIVESIKKEVKDNENRGSVNI